MTNCVQTKKGIRIQVNPGARNWIMVVIILIDPSKDEVIRKIIPISQIVCPASISASGGYEVHPDLAAPSAVKKLLIITTPPTK